MQHDSFLPDEYIEHRRNRRTSYLVMAMFLVVVASIGGAFLHRHFVLQDALQRQQNALSRYETAAEQVEIITELQESRDEMIARAILASALVERVPRSVLLADIIQRMPEGLSLVKLDLTSTLVRVQQPQAGTSTRTGRPPRRPGRGDPVCEDVEQVFAAPQYTVRLALEGLAPTDLHVSQFLASLNSGELLESVRLESTEEDLLDDMAMRRFKITFALRPGADVRLHSPTMPPGTTFSAATLEDLQ